MSLTSTVFYAFLIAGLLVYYILPAKFRWVWLLIMSYVYYWGYNVKSSLYMVFDTVIIYFAAMLIWKINDSSKKYLAQNKEILTKDEKKKYKEKTKKKKRLVLAGGLVLTFGLLAVLKYSKFFLINFESFFVSIGVTNAHSLACKMIMAMGLSFYTFQSASYLIDVYMGKYDYEKNIFKLGLFISFFPQILEGPIGRYDRLAPQLFKGNKFELKNIQYGFQRVIWGLAKKFILADRAYVFVEAVFGKYYEYGGFVTIAAVLMYSVELYCDFSGGIDIVIGVAQMFGIKMDENFRQPFFSKSISEFWRRWHITLGTWMKDYVFYPFSLSKKMMKFSKLMKKHFGTFAGKTLPICLADLLIFFLVGVWHGAAWKFIVYGMYNGIIIAASSLLEPVYEKMFKVTHINKNAKWYRVFQIIRTFILVNIGWFFDDAANLKESFVLMKNVFVNFSIKPLFDVSVRAMMEFSSMDMLAIAVGIAALFIVGVINEKGIDIRKSLAKKPLILRWAVYLMLVMSIPVLGYVSAETGGFLYAQF